MKNEEITENEMDRKMDTDLEKTFSILQKSLKEQTAEPPAMVDSFIKAAARQRLKKEHQTGKLRFIAWFTGAAAVFAVTFSALYFTGFTGTMPPEQTAQMGTETFAADPEQDWDWDLVFAEMEDFSEEFHFTGDGFDDDNDLEEEFFAYLANPF